MCGLSQQEAAQFLDVRIDTVKSWSSGRNPVPSGVWAMLAGLFEQIQDAAEDALEVLDERGIEPADFVSLSADNGAEPLPSESACEMAGAMALLMAVANTKSSG